MTFGSLIKLTDLTFLPWDACRMIYIQKLVLYIKQRLRSGFVEGFLLSSENKFSSIRDKNVTKICV